MSLETKSHDRFYTTVETTEIDGQAYELKIRISSKLPLSIEPYGNIKGDFMLYNLGEHSEESREHYLSQNVYVGGYCVGESVVSPCEE